jgi:endonuclease YncB( thermonuclease family)
MLNHRYLFIIIFTSIFISCKEKKPYLPEYEDIETLIQQDSVKVIGISDGDSFTVLFKNEPFKIRIHGIDAPERDMPFYKTSKGFLASLIFNKYVNLEITDKDKYQRFVADVYLNNQVNIGYEMIKKGMAWHYLKYSDDSKMTDYEQIARDFKIGLWQDNNPEAPWEFRKNQRESLK